MLERDNLYPLHVSQLQIGALRVRPELYNGTLLDPETGFTAFL